MGKDRSGSELRQRGPNASPSAVAAATGDNHAPDTSKQRRSTNVSRDSPWPTRLLCVLIGSLLTLTLLWSLGRLGAPRFYPHYSTYLQTQHVARASLGPTLVPFEAVPWQKQRTVSNRIVPACIPPFHDDAASAQVVQYRGFDHLGIIDTDHTKNMPTIEHLQPLWVLDGVNVGIHTASKSSPIVDRDVRTGQATLYVGADNARLYAINAETGELRWVYHVRSCHNGIHGTPAVDEDRVYIGNYGGWLTALDKRTGEFVWEAQLGMSIGASPMIVGDRVCSGIERGRPRANGYLACCDRTTGHILFYSEEFGDHTHGTPTIAWRTGKTQGDWSSRPEITAHAPIKTSCNWKVMCSSPLAKLSPSFSEAQLTSFEARSCQPGSPFEAELRAVARSSPRDDHKQNALYHVTGLSAGLFVIGANTGVFYGLDSVTGVEVWNYPTRGAIARPVLLQIQKERKEAAKVKANAKKAKNAIKEKEAQGRLAEAKVEKRRAFTAGELDSDAAAEWTEEDEEEFWGEEEQREEEEQEEEEEEEEEDGRDQNDPDQWVKEDTAELCVRVPKVCENVQYPWIWLLNNPDNGNQGQIKGTAAVYGHIAIFVSWDSFVYAIDINDGTAVWVYQTRGLGMSSASILPASKYLPESHPHHRAIEGMVFVGTHDWSIYGLQLSTGQLLWRYQTGAKVLSSGVLTNRSGVPGVAEKCGKDNPWVLLWGSFDGVIYELCASNGTLLGKKALNSGALTNELAVFENTVYAATNGGKLIALRQPQA